MQVPRPTVGHDLNPLVTDCLGTGENLRREIAGIDERAGVAALAVAYYDYQHRIGWSYHGDRWFHAASTIKVPVLLGVFHAVDRGLLYPYSRVHVRNRFLSVADGRAFRIDASRDSSPEVHQAIGRTLKVRELARHMIATSSNLATNILIDLVGIEEIQQTMRDLGLNGIDFRRGVEDMAAWAVGLNNQVTAHGLLSALRVIAEQQHFSADSCREMLDILHAQEFKRGIPAGLPEHARVAHKTGEISTVAHDAGIVFLPERKPYVVVILTEWDPDATGRQATIARISRAVFQHVTDGDGDD